MDKKIESTSAHYLFREAELPEPTENVKNGTVQWGKDNLYPQFLWSLYYNMPIHQGIVNQKVTFVVGEGVEGIKGWEGINDKIQKNGKSDYSLDEIIEMVAFDFEVIEGYYLLFKKDVTTGEYYVETLSAELIRPSENLDYFDYSENWMSGSQSLEKTGFKRYTSIHERTPELVEQGVSFVMYVKSQPKQVKFDDSNKLTSSIFPIQSYSGAITSIMAGIEMNWFQYSEVINGWSSNTILNLNNGEPPSPEMKNDILKNIKLGATDKKKKGGLTVFFNNGVERAATIENLSNNGNDTKYLLTLEYITETIMIAHSVQSAELFGLQVAGKLGNSDLATSFAQFNQTYVSKRQKNISESITWGLSILNEWGAGKIEFKAFTPFFEKQIGEENKLAEKLNAMSPIVATKVLNSLTINEIRTKLAGELPIDGGDKIDTGLEGFSKQVTDEMVLGLFSNCGEQKESVNVIHSIEFTGDKTDEQFISEYTNYSFDLKLTDEQKVILKMIKGGESYSAIRKAINESQKGFMRKLLDLEKLKVLKGWDVLPKANEIIQEQPQFKVVYSYELRPDAPKLLTESRDFCKTLIDLNRVYTRIEIDKITAAIGRDVWLYRGGWYTDPNTEKSRPSCRHYWLQNLIQIK